MVAEVVRRYFNVDEYYRMAEVGILSEEDRFELIEGEIVQVSPIGPRHAARVDRLNKLLNKRVGDEAIIRVQSPVRLHDYSEPEPDVAVLKPRDDYYETGHPTAADVLLVIEISDSSGQYDRDVKLPMYARAGISEVWIMNIQADTFEINREPVNGMYQESIKAGRGESISPLLLSRLTFAVNDLLG